jgi:hypothetical protein
MQSITSARDYLEIVLNDNVNVSATVVGGDADGVFPATVTPGTYSGSTTLTHNIGSVPITRIFYDSDKNGTLYNTIRWTDGLFYLGSVVAPQGLVVNTTTTTKLLINAPSSVSNVPIYYRVYRFGDKSVTSEELIDKIFDKGTSSRTITAASDSDTPKLATDTIPHNQGEKIFWSLEFAESANGPWYKEGTLLFGDPDTSSGPPGGPYARYEYKTAYGYADATNFYVNYVHNHTSSQTIYVRYVWDFIN